ncbi:uncharacterized protein N0V89_001183 [Didymosphaeria variabile]|uniref:TLC domain-containing protein n=1 Tax=Didymosphaeria variabile TaxID=1932322 RepID=A0A9W9CGG8_9PLEO|nr:uncharacterized protein N0V89_001183 [Didymosphaeria variabile]KAJ4360617.1 hypothetical protein N0V89_001183 [Didymosphaeria variabile]
MHDPFPFPCPDWLRQRIEPFADYVSLKTLPLHIHEVLLAFSLYSTVNIIVAPIISRFFFPRIYPSFNARTKLNWDVHIVSFVQSTVICVLALWVMANDEERSEMNWAGKVHGYTGAGGLIQAFAGGYFLWDLVITVQNINVFGLGMLAHAVSALFVFSLGFRPFVNFYAPTFILYELSSPFLNIHWFCDKLKMTGSKVQLYNGIILLCTFFGCRLCWGTYQSVRVFYDVYRAITAGEFVLQDPELGKLSNGTTVDPNAIPTSDIMRFAGERTVPLWLAACYLLSNLTLNGLNWFWFGKMIETIRKRFDPPLGTRKPEVNELGNEQVLVEGISLQSPPQTPYAHASGTDAKDYIGAVKVEKKSNHLEIEQMEIRKRTGEDGRPMSSARAA